jgi:hypothetical protein
VSKEPKPGTVEAGAQFGGQRVRLFNADGSERAVGILRHIELLPGEGAYDRHVAIDLGEPHGLRKFYARAKDRLEPIPDRDFPLAA